MTWCVCLTLKTECIIGGLIFIVIASIKIILLLTYSGFSEGLQTVFILSTLLLVFGAVLLLLGVTKEDRVCIITFLCFDVCVMIAEAICLLLLYATGTLTDKVPEWILILIVLEYVPCVYMIPTSLREYRVLKDKDLYLTEHFSRSVVLPSLSQQTGHQIGF